MDYKRENKGSNFSQKRRIINKKECLFDNGNNLKIVFRIVDKAINSYNQKLSDIPPHLRVRTFEAVTLLQEIVIALAAELPDNCKFAKYKRFVLRFNGYQFLIKKLNKKNLPMNISTKNCSLINNQAMRSLFENEPGYHDAIEPLLYIGYKKNKFGVIGDLTVVYIDENKLQWTITGNDLDIVYRTNKEASEQSKVRLKPKLIYNEDSQEKAN